MGFDAYPQFQLTYAASTVGLTPVAACTDIGSIRGDGTKLIRLRQIIIAGTATANDSVPVIIVKRLSLNAGGGITAITPVPFDSTQPTSIATVVSYAALPTLGTTTGGGSLVGSRLILAKPTASGGSGDSSVLLYFGGKSDFMRAPSILNSNEMLCINFNGGAVPSGAAIDFSLVWTEEPLP